MQYGSINSNSRSKINWVTGLGTLIVAIANTGAQSGLISQEVADNTNQLVALTLPPVVFILRSFFTVKD